jgi:hypothetical protein
MDPKRQRVSQILVTIFFIAQIVVAITLNHRYRQSQSSDTASGDAFARYGFTLVESARQRGIDFVHQPPALDPKLAPILPRVADMGAGIAVGDFDKDGFVDFYVTNSGENSQNRLYRNNGDGTFTDVAAAMGVADVNRDGTGTSMGALWGDFDNDGYEDLLVYKWGTARLFHNDGGKGFTDITAKADLPHWMNANTAVLLDYDRDGKLDILLCGYFHEKIDLWHLTGTDIMPDSLEYATNGTAKHLLRGHGDGTFEDVTAAVGMDKARAWTLASVSADFNGDGWPDIFLANDYGHAELWVNDGGKRFRNVREQALAGSPPKSGMNASFGDIYNSGKLAIYVSNIWENTLLQQGNNLWVPRAGTTLAYDNQAGAMGVENGGWSFGAQFGDLNNDGFVDLFLVNGYISGDRNQSYWYDYSQFSTGNAALIRDARNWPAVKNRSLAGYQQKKLWLNDGAGAFKDIAPAVGVTSLDDGRAVALADIDNDGALDVLVANQRGPLLLYHNKIDTKRHWIGFALEGTKSNKSAIGAQVTVFWNGQKQTQFVTGGSGFCAQNDRRLHFGLGTTATVEKVEIQWPSGTMTTLTGPKTDTMHALLEKES